MKFAPGTTTKQTDMKKGFIAISSICLLCSCGNQGNDEQHLRFVETARPVEVADSVKQTFSGIIEEAHQTNLAFKIAGQIKSITVSEGQRVSKGQLMAALDDADYKLEKEAVEIQYNQLKDEVERTKRLYEQKSVSKNDYEKATAGLQQLAIQLQGYNNKLDYTKLYAPYDCFVQKVNFDPAEMVNAGTTVFELIDASRFEVVIDIPTSTKMQDLQSTRFYCKSPYGNEEVPITLKSIVPKADGNQLYRARFTMPAPKAGTFTAGMNVEVVFKSIKNDVNRQSTIPESAVINDGTDTYVWIVNADSTLSKRYVDIERINSDGTAFLNSGLDGSETVVKSGASTLQEGEKVKIMPEPSESNVGGLL